jgi:hypothetical protein
LPTVPFPKEAAESMVAGTASHVRVATGAIKKKLAIIFGEED